MSEQNLWVVKSDRGGVPVGEYQATFLHVEEFEKPEKGITGKWRWVWSVSSPSQVRGMSVSCLTNRTLHPKSTAGKLLSGMIGRALVPGEDVRGLIDGLKGKPFLVTYADGPLGGKPQVRKAKPQ